MVYYIFTTYVFWTPDPVISTSSPPVPGSRLAPAQHRDGPLAHARQQRVVGVQACARRLQEAQDGARVGGGADLALPLPPVRLEEGLSILDRDRTSLKSGCGMTVQFYIRRVEKYRMC